MSDLIKAVPQKFQNINLTRIDIDGRPWWLATEVSRALGYADPSQVATEINRSWDDEFREEKDYRRVKGAELVQLKQALTGLPAQTAGSALLPANAPSLILLSESGFNLVCILSRQPLGKALRRWLADEVLPSITRTGGYSTPATAPRLIGEREDRANVIKSLVHDVCDILNVAHEARAAQMVGVMQDNFPEDNYQRLLPVEKQEWFNATEIGEECGVTNKKIGAVAKKLHLKGDPAYTRRVLNKAKNNNRTVHMWQYNLDAVEKIASELGAL